jgi:hypothetical protein
MIELSVAELSIKGFDDGFKNKEILLENLNKKDINQNIIFL